MVPLQSEPVVPLEMGFLGLAIAFQGFLVVLLAFIVWEARPVKKRLGLVGVLFCLLPLLRFERSQLGFECRSAGSGRRLPCFLARSVPRGIVHLQVGFEGELIIVGDALRDYLLAAFFRQLR